MDGRIAYRINRVTQPVVLVAATPQALLERCEQLLAAMEGQGEAAMAAYQEVTQAGKAPEIPADAARLGFVADTLEEARGLLKSAVTTLRARLDAESWDHPKGITYRRTGMATEGHLVALFPGQGSQYLNMGADLAMNFPPIREMYARMDALFLDEGLTPLSTVVFPPPVFDKESEKLQDEALRATDYAQAGIGVFSAGLFKLLAGAGFRPDFTAGHSFGELSALWAGGILSEDDFLKLVKARGKAMCPPDDPDFDAGSMAAVQGALPEIENVIEAFENVIIANQNSNTQVVIAGPTEDVRLAGEALGAKGIKATILPVSAAFHTPAVGHASEPFAKAVMPTTFHKPRAVVFSNTTGDPYPGEDDAEAAKSLLANHILNPVLFKRQIERIYEAGGRIFVECGPRRITTGLVEDILGAAADGGEFVAVALNASRTASSDRQFREAVVRLRVAGLNLGDVDPYELAA